MNNSVTPPKPSDLKIRVLSAIVMIAVAGSALWIGGVWFDAFILIVACVTFFEFERLLFKATPSVAVRAIGTVAGFGYIGLATWLLTKINSTPLLLLITGTVIAIDVFAYFFGRSIGGPKIAPSISPSKTWAGLAGGMIGATVAVVAYFSWGGLEFRSGWLFELLPFAAFLAIIAQTGDFFESWLKRRAGVKDSSNLIPGHGGFFDRVDGLLPVAIVIGLVLVNIFPHWLNR